MQLQPKTKLSPVIPGPLHGGRLQRKCACGQHTVAGGECSECGKQKDMLQRKALSGEEVNDVPPIVHQVLRSTGQPLDNATRAYTEPRFGHDFSRVRVRAEKAAGLVQTISVLDQDTTATQSSVRLRQRRALSPHVDPKNPFPIEEEEGRRLPETKPKRERELKAGIVAGESQHAAHQTRSLRQKQARVWGVDFTNQHCGCRGAIRANARWADTARQGYQECRETPGMSSGDDIENCFDGKFPSSTVVGTTSSSGNVVCQRDPGPCGFVDFRGCLVHETFHRRHAEDLHRRFPDPTAFDAAWNDPNDWANDEINSYTWERRFWIDLLEALNNECL